MESDVSFPSFFAAGQVHIKYPEYLHHPLLASGVSRRRHLDSKGVDGPIMAVERQPSVAVTRCSANFKLRIHSTDLDKVTVVVPVLQILSRNVDFIPSAMVEFNQPMA